MDALFNHYGDSCYCRNTTDMKTFTLDSDIFIQTFNSEYELIEWTFEWNGVTYMNQEFIELVVDNFCNN